MTTAEGDRITLSADLEADLQAVSYQSSVQTDGASVDVAAKTVEYSLTQKLGVTVEGDLNKEELHDLEQLFQKVSSIFRNFLSGHDDEALTKTTNLAERFDKLSSLSDVDLSVEVERSITLFATQVAAEAGPSPLPANQSQALPATSSSNTPGRAPTAVAAIPQPSTGTTAPTQPSRSSTDTAAGPDLRPAAPAHDDKLASLVQQVFDAIRGSQIETGKLQKHLPHLLERARENLKDDPAHKPEGDRHDTPDVTPSSNHAALFTYQSFSQTSFNLSVHS